MDKEAKTGMWRVDPKTGQLKEYIGPHQETDKALEGVSTDNTNGGNLSSDLSEISEFPTADQYLPTGKEDFSL